MQHSYKVDEVDIPPPPSRAYARGSLRFVAVTANIREHSTATPSRAYARRTVNFGNFRALLR